MDHERALTDLSQIPEIDVITGDWMSEADMTVNGAKRAEPKAKLGDIEELGAVREGFQTNFLSKVEPALFIWKGTKQSRSAMLVGATRMD